MSCKLFIIWFIDNEKKRLRHKVFYASGKPINGVPKAGLSAEGTQHREIGIPISANNASWANAHDSTKFGKQFKWTNSTIEFVRTTNLWIRK